MFQAEFQASRVSILNQGSRVFSISSYGISAPLQRFPEAEPELGGSKIAGLSVGAVSAREPVPRAAVLVSGSGSRADVTLQSRVADHPPHTENLTDSVNHSTLLPW